MSDARFHQKRTNIKTELELIDEKLKESFSDNSSDLIELQVERSKLLDQLRYFRPNQPEDIAYRENMFKTFPAWAEQNISENMRLVFHGTTLANTERILNSGRIISGKDRWSIHTSGDDAGEFSVSTKDFLEVIDTKEKLADMIEDGAGIEYNVKIGKDEKGGIERCAIVTAKYRYKGREIGHAGVIGPERMDYGKVISILESVKKAIDDIDGGSDGR